MPRLRPVALLLLLAAAGCATAPPAPPPEADAATLDRSTGHALLGALLEDESRLGLILILKRPSTETATLLRRITERATLAKEEYPAVLAAEPAVVPAEEPLPPLEQRVRASIASRTSRELTLGDAFEVRVLLTQAEALRYGDSLARALAQVEPETTRRTWLLALAADFDALRERVVERLGSLGSQP